MSFEIFARRALLGSAAFVALAASPAPAPAQTAAQPADVLDREVQAWAVMGANVFIGLRFGIWGEEDGEAVAAAANRLFKDGLATR